MKWFFGWSWPISWTFYNVKNKDTKVADRGDSQEFQDRKDKPENKGSKLFRKREDHKNV